MCGFVQMILVYSGEYCVWFNGCVHVFLQHCLLFVVLTGDRGCLCYACRYFATNPSYISSILETFANIKTNRQRVGLRLFL
jgi:hypothetical protein